VIDETREAHAMKPNIHPELYRAMQTAREEDISRAAWRPRGEGYPDRSAWVARYGRAVAFIQRALRDASVNLPRQVDAPTTIRVNVPPLADNSPLGK
jgi:hypothetical protein